jgi:RNA polymerase sigma-70 factor (ECF subfamily)
VSAEALPMPRLVPSTSTATQAEARLRRLVDRIKQDDVLAFEELYRLTRDEVARTLFHLVGRRCDLDELVQETYLHLLQAVPHFRGDTHVRTFLFRVCATVAPRHLRWWRRPRPETSDSVPECVAVDADAGRAAQASRLVHQALDALSAKKRVVFVFHELCGLGPEEIAQATGVSYHTVRSRLHQARLEFTRALRALTSEVMP